MRPGCPSAARTARRSPRPGRSGRPARRRRSGRIHAVRAAGTVCSRPCSCPEERLGAESALRDAVVDALGEESDRAELRTVLGLAGRNLIDTARRVNAQLNVLAGRGSASMLLGTVSQYVLRKAPCPVLVVPEAR